MIAKSPLQIQAHELVAELIDACSWLADSQTTPDEFRRTVVAYESRKLTRLGYLLDSAVTPTGVVQFSLRIAETGELCASLDVDPVTGDLTMQQTWD
jgi:hypothetical protein